METIITQLLASIQSGMMVYILYLHFKYHFKKKYTYFFLLVTILFVLLKNQILALESYTIIDWVAWAIYNLMIYYYIFILIKSQIKCNIKT